MKQLLAMTVTAIKTKLDVPKRFHQRSSKLIATRNAINRATRNSHSAGRLSKSSSSPWTTVSWFYNLLLSKHIHNHRLSLVVPPDTRTIRSCAFEEGKYKNTCYQRSGFGGRQEVCACSTDLCNGAATFKATFGVLLAAIVVFAARV